MTSNGTRLRFPFLGVVAAGVLITGCTADRSSPASTTKASSAATGGSTSPPSAAQSDAPVLAKGSPWAGALFDARHSSDTPATGPQRGSAKWTAKLGGALTPGPVVGIDGSVLAGSNDGVLHALDPATGKDRWVFDGKGGYGNDLSTSPAVLADGTILWPGSGDTLFALDRRGKVLWREKFDAQVLSPAVGKAGRVYVADMSGQVAALKIDGKKHTKVWSTSLGGTNYASPVIGQNGQIYTADGDNLIALKDLGARGRIAWKFAAKRLIEVSPAVGPDGTVVIGTNGAGEFGVHPDGTQAWNVPNSGWTYSSPVIRSSGQGAFGDNLGRVRLFDASTGKVQRTLAPGDPKEGGIWTSVVIDARGNTYWATTAGRVYGYDSGGRQLFTVKLDGAAWGYPALGADGTLYLGTSAGTFYAIGN